MPDPSPYLALKLARELYSKSPEALDGAEHQRVTAVARRQAEIEGRILATVEASSVVLPESSIKHALAEIRERYGSDDEYQQDLARVGLAHATLRAAIERDLRVEAVLDQVARRAPPVSPVEIEIFYLQHADKFLKPETRSLRHILITINESLNDNERATALAKIEAIRARLTKSPERFAEQALKHSECPTAMNGGLLGQVPRGTLFPEIEAVAFALPAGGLSEIVESPMGFHVVLCENIEPERHVPLAEASERIQARINEDRCIAIQKAWVAGLFASA